MSRFYQKFIGYLEKFWERYHLRITVSGMVLLFLVAYFWNNIVISIMPGEAGVLWRRLGGGVVLDHTYGEGIHIIWPFNRMYIYDIRVQQIADTVTFLDTNGLTIHAEVSVRYYPDVNKLPRLHQKIGPEYPVKIIIPELISAMRIELGAKAYQEIYTQQETKFLSDISSHMLEALKNRDIILDEVLLTRLKLPDDLAEAIQDKLVKQQLLLAYEYRLQTEEKEKQRKLIEAEGIAQFEETSKIPILQWRGIQATETLANSPNSKIVIVGNNSGSLPVLLSVDK